MRSITKRNSIGLAVAAGTTSLLVSTAAHAQTVGNFIGPSGAWTNPILWQDNIIPNGQGHTAQHTGTGATPTNQILRNDVAGHTVGTIRLTGTAAVNNLTFQVQPNQNVIMDQDGPGPLSASWINDLQGAAGTTHGLFIQIPAAGNSGAFFLQDDLFISNTSNSVRPNASIGIRGALRGNGNITVENVTNNIAAGQISFENNESTGPGAGGFGGDIFINKGAVTFNRGDVFTPTNKTVTIGAAGKGDVTLAFVGDTLGNLEYNLVAAANTGGTTLFVANATTIQPVNIKTTFTNAATVTLNGDMTFDNRGVVGSTLIVGDQIVGGGGFTKVGAGPMRVTNTNSYEGGTVVNVGGLTVAHAPEFNNGFGTHAATDGTLGSGDVTVAGGASLKIETDLFDVDVIRNTAALSVDGTATLETSVNDTIGGLVLGGVTQTANGTYGAPGSGAAHEDAHFSGPGFVNLQLGRVLHWDTNGTTAGAGGATPAGNWNGAAVNFNTQADGGTGGTRSARTLSTDPVVFTAGADGTGTYTVNVNGTQQAASVSVARGDVTLAGGGITSPTFDVASGATATVTGTVTGPSGSVTKSGTGTLQVTRLPHLNALTISGGTVRVLESSPTLADGLPTGNNASVSRPSSLTVAAGSTLDLSNNDMILDYTNEGDNPAVAIEALIAQGYNGGNWFGTGITSSVAQQDGNFALAIADNGLLNTAYTSFSGESVDSTTVLVKFTWVDDIDLDGMVTTNDAITFGNNYSLGDPATRATGDMDYDGVFTTNDAIIFGNNYDTSLPSLPEPATLTAAGLLGLAMVRHRRYTASR